MGQAILIAVIAGGVYFAGSKTVHGIKKVNHAIICVVKTGHNCPKK